MVALWTVLCEPTPFAVVAYAHPQTLISPSLSAQRRECKTPSWCCLLRTPRLLRTSHTPVSHPAKPHPCLQLTPHHNLHPPHPVCVQSAKRLNATCAWRASQKPEDVVCKACAINPRSHYMHVVGHSSNGWPIIYSCIVGGASVGSVGDAGCGEGSAWPAPDAAVGGAESVADVEFEAKS